MKIAPFVQQHIDRLRPKNMMSVGDLIAELQKYSPNDRLYINTVHWDHISTESVREVRYERWATDGTAGVVLNTLPYSEY